MATGSGTRAADPVLVRSLLILTVVTGLIDAVSYLGVGRTFTANMTGNIVFLGFALGGAPGVSAVRPIAALAAFALGSLCGGRIVRSRQRTAARYLVIAMRAEAVLLMAGAGAAAFGPPEMSSATAYALIVSTAVAMGLRSAVVRALAIPDLTTTVLTSTLAGLAADSSLAGGDGARSGRRLLSIVAMIGGALVGAILLRAFTISVPLIVAALVVAGWSVYVQRAAHRALQTSRPDR